jgi:hypothetical protein
VRIGISLTGSTGSAGCAQIRVPGIAVHMPIGEQHYVSVAFSVAGQVRGQEGDEYLNSAMRAFGDCCALRAREPSTRTTASVDACGAV